MVREIFILDAVVPTLLCILLSFQLVFMLIFIQKTLGFGKVYISGKVSYYEVYDLNNIAKIIEIFTKYSLNSRNIYEF